MEPVRMDLWYADASRMVQDKRGKEKPELRKIEITPTKPVTRQSVQKDVVDALRTVVDVAESYYVVMVVKKGDGTLGYRTFIPKTLVR